MSDPTGSALIHGGYDGAGSYHRVRTAVIFGVTGQDGSFLAELLLARGYHVVGVVRRTSTPNTVRLEHLQHDSSFELVQGDVTDAFSVYRILHDYIPHEVYNLAAQSEVGVSFQEPSHTWQATAGGALNILEAIRQVGPECIRFYQASSSEMFGSSFSEEKEFSHGAVLIHSRPGEKPSGEWCFQNEETPMLPNSPYAVAKLAGHHLCRIYRESYGVFACSGILFNHESERRGLQFVTRKITRYAGIYARARDNGREPPGKLKLGNLEARRDWGFAGDYVRAMHLMLQRDRPDHYVVATGETHSVRDFLHAAFRAIGESPEVAERLVEHDPTLLRPCEVPYLRGDASKARRELGWEPEVDFDGLVWWMVLYDLESSLTNHRAGDHRVRHLRHSTQ